MKKSNLEKLVVLVKHFVSKHTTVFAGVTGNDHQLIKNHLYFHLHQYIKKCLVLQLVGIPHHEKDTTKQISKHHQKIHNRMHLHWSSRHTDKIWRRASSTDQCVWGNPAPASMYLMFHRNPEGKQAGTSDKISYQTGYFTYSCQTIKTQFNQPVFKHFFL